MGVIAEIEKVASVCEIVEERAGDRGKQEGANRGSGGGWGL